MCASLAVTWSLLTGSVTPIRVSHFRGAVHDKTGLSCHPIRQENRGVSKAFQPDSLLDLTGSRTEENREALSDYRERLLKRRPFRVRVRSAPPEARHCVPGVILEMILAESGRSSAGGARGGLGANAQ